MQTPARFLPIGAAYGFIGVALGAFGAHGLEAQLIARDAVDIWQTAVSYQMWHALALIAVALLQHHGIHKPTAGWCFTLGTAIFSGTLYGIGFGGPRWLGAITPIGGLLMLTGWLLLCLPTKSNN